MLYYDFYKLSHRMPYDKHLIKQYFNLNESLDFHNLSIDEIWEIALKVYSDLQENIEYEELKSDVLMTIYTSVLYQSSKVKPKSSIPKIFLNASGYSDQCFEGRQRRLADISKDLSSSYSDLYIASHQNITNFLNYFSPYWIDRGDNFKSLNDIDYYYYLQNYKHWPYYPANENGMGIGEWFEAMEEIFKKPGFELSSDKFEQDFSAFMLEKLFSPKHFMDSITCYFKYFNELFFDLKSPSRERAMILTIPFSLLPSPLGEEFEKEYFNSIKKYLDNEQDCTSLSICLYEVNRHRFFLYPILVSLTAYLLYEKYINTNSNLIDFEMLCGDLKGVLSKDNLNNFHNDMQKTFDNFSTIYYPVKSKGKDKDKQPSTKLVDENNAKRNNSSINTFEINYTHYFFSNIFTSDCFSPNLYPINWQEYIIRYGKGWISTASDIKSPFTRNYRKSTL